MQTGLEHNDSKLLELFQPDLEEIRRSLSSTEALDEQNRKVATYVCFIFRNTTEAEATFPITSGSSEVK
jgi:Lhr-like helicase